MFVFDSSELASSSNMPMPMAAATVRGRFSIRPITAAASRRRSSELPPPDTLENDANPRSGTRSITAVADSTAARAHTRPDRRRVGMPRRLARSSLSAAARMPTP